MEIRYQKEMAAERNEAIKPFYKGRTISNQLHGYQRIPALIRVKWL